MASATRLFIDTPLSVGTLVTLPEGACRHLVQVLRARPGDPVILFDGRGGEYEATIEVAGKRDATVRIRSHSGADAGESRLRLVLAQAVSKGDRMDYTLQKAVELGVSEIQPLVTERSVVRLDAERWDRKLEHWRGVIVSACEQSGRTRLPLLHPVLGLASWLERGPATALKLTLAPAAQHRLRELAPAGSACLLVDPEGGLSDGEIAQSEHHGHTAVRFGPRVLRTETAGVAALAAMQALWGDLG